ncbi:MAG TPA: phosphoribosyltransferase family protein [Blastocatellia bacterium]|nr:phosphoribosyltransferase family protein [Blastocatellia bacterium]
MDDKLRVVKSKEEIQTRIGELAEEIRAFAPSGEVTVVGILDDAFVFLADLIRVLDIQLNCCFMKVTKHRHGGQSEILYTSEFDPRGRDILLVSAVASTGITLDYISNQLSTRGVKSLRTCVLIDRPSERRVNLVPNFSAFQMDGQFVCGYGLGIQNQFRQLPYLAVMKDWEGFEAQ